MSQPGTQHNPPRYDPATDTKLFHILYSVVRIVQCPALCYDHKTLLLRKILCGRTTGEPASLDETVRSLDMFRTQVEVHQSAVTHLSPNIRAKGLFFQTTLVNAPYDVQDAVRIRMVEELAQPAGQPTVNQENPYWKSLKENLYELLEETALGDSEPRPDWPHSLQQLQAWDALDGLYRADVYLADSLLKNIPLFDFAKCVRRALDIYAGQPSCSCRFSTAVRDMSYHASPTTPEAIRENHLKVAILAVSIMHPEIIGVLDQPGRFSRAYRERVPNAMLGLRRALELPDVQDDLDAMRRRYVLHAGIQVQPLRLSWWLHEARPQNIARPPREALNIGRELLRNLMVSLSELGFSTTPGVVGQPADAVRQWEERKQRAENEKATLTNGLH